MRIVKVEPTYILVRTINGPFGQLIVSRLRSEGIDLRLINNNSSTIYPLDSIGTKLEVRSDQKDAAMAILSEIEQSALKPNLDMDFSDASAEDIEFEKEVHEREERIKNAKPPILIYVLILIILITVYYVTSLKR